MARPTWLVKERRATMLPGEVWGPEQPMSKSGYVYILANRRNGTLYIRVTSDLAKRVYEHRIGAAPGFTRRCGCKLLVWYEAFEDLDAARMRELQMKEWRRAWKPRLIEEANPDWADLYETPF
jgi:putative endonuclease